MKEFFCTKAKTARSWALVPAHGTDEEVMKTLPKDLPFRVKVTQVRNIEFHRKYFALLNYAFEIWEPPSLSYEDMQRACGYGLGPEEVEKNFDRFRHDIAILAGFYTATTRINGELRLEAKSISFASMDQDEFERLYDKTIDVVTKHVLKNYSVDEVRRVMDQIEQFE